MARKEERSTWGGARPGAGRKVKARPRKVLSISLDPEIVRQVEVRSARYNFNRSLTIEKALIAWLQQGDTPRSERTRAGDDAQT